MVSKLHSAHLRSDLSLLWLVEVEYRHQVLHSGQLISSNNSSKAWFLTILMGSHRLVQVCLSHLDLLVPNSQRVNKGRILSNSHCKEVIKCMSMKSSKIWLDLLGFAPLALMTICSKLLYTIEYLKNGTTIKSKHISKIRLRKLIVMYKLVPIFNLGLLLISNWSSKFKKKTQIRKTCIQSKSTPSMNYLKELQKWR